jgi:eukaryotic-like serine/threonine-protein kinase
VTQSSSPQSDRLIGQIIAERYQILSVLGEGGMGRVYRAEHVRMGRKSAVKVLSPNMALSADAITRFNREAANASRINHPNVAQIYDFGETRDGMLYLAMELVEGETLRSLIQRNGPLPMRRAADLARQVADALGAAHYLGIVHRDLKPDNILLTRYHDGADWVKVVDFGIAKTVQGSGGENRGGKTVTTAGVSLGTPDYMSPEQLAGERLDARTDLYSLGLVLFNMLTANLPYPRVTSKETLVRRLTSRPQTLAEVAPWGQWPPQLQAVLDRALAPEPEDRYASVRELGREVLAASIAGATVRLPTPSGRYTLGPTEPIATPVPRTRAGTRAPARRRSLVVAGALIVVAAGVAGAFVAMRQRGGKSLETMPAVATALAAAPSRDMATTVARDSRPATAPSLPAPPPMNSADTTPANRDKTMARLRHPMLRATGDSASGATMPSTDPERIRILGEDIQGHLARAMQFIRRGDILKARGEVREMAPVVVVLRQLYGGNPGEARVEQMLRTGEGQSVAACRVAMQDSVSRDKLPPTFRCEQLVPQGMRGQRGGRNPSAEPWNR